MKYLDEYRDPVLAKALLAELHALATRPWALMEVCGGQTRTLVRQGIDELLPAGMRMIHGPGCPVCVTPAGTIDLALRIAALPGVVFTSFGVGGPRAAEDPRCIAGAVLRGAAEPVDCPA